MKNVEASFSLVLKELREKYRSDPETSALVSEAEQAYLALEKSFEDRHRLDLDEIEALKRLAGAETGTERARLFQQGVEIERLRRDLDLKHLELKGAWDKFSTVRLLTQNLEKDNAEITQRYIKTKQLQDMSMASLDKDKIVLNQGMDHISGRLNSMSEELAQACKKLEDQFRNEQIELEHKMLEAMKDALAKQKNYLLNEQRSLLQGFHGHVSAHIAGMGAILKRALDKFPVAITPFQNMRPSFVDWLLSLSERHRRMDQFQRKIQPELTGLKEALKQTMDGFEKIQAHLSDFSSVAKGAEIKPVRLSLNEVVGEVLLVQDETLKARNVSVTESRKEVPPIWADRQMVQAALTEVLLNAVDAQPRGGEIEMLFEESAEEGWAGVYVRDHGPGVLRSIQDKIFQPFFTTKDRRHGLGLTRAFHWCLLNNGAIEVKREKTTGGFLLKFPIHQRGQ